nr:hypothetical protein [Nocardia nova]
MGTVGANHPVRAYPVRGRRLVQDQIHPVAVLGQSGEPDGSHGVHVAMAGEVPSEESAQCGVVEMHCEGEPRQRCERTEVEVDAFAGAQYVQAPP